MNKAVIKKIEKEAKKFFAGASGCHDWTHVERVKNLALHIGGKEKADLAVLEIAALLHDIARNEEMRKGGSFCHAERGAQLAKKILRKYKISDSDAKNIIHCIESHRYRNNKIPKTTEAKILYEADKLDSIGAIGLARAFVFAGGLGSGNIYTGNEKKLAKTGEDYNFSKEDSALLEYEVKLKYIKNKMLTKEGKRIAKERHKYMADYFERLKKEIKGDL